MGTHIPDDEPFVDRPSSDPTSKTTPHDSERRLAVGLMGVDAHETNPEVYARAARFAKQHGMLRECLAILERGIAKCPPDPGLHAYYVERLEKCNRTDQAIAAARSAVRLFADDPAFSLREALMLPVLYDTTEQLAYFRRRFAEGLQKLETEVRLDTPKDRQAWLWAIGSSVNKYLAYQGLNDRELQLSYGRLVHRIMNASFPSLTQSLAMPPVPADGRLRIGYVSKRFRDVSVTKAFLGWIREHDRSRVAAFGYHAGQSIDAVTEHVRVACHRFRQLDPNIETIAATVQADNLHVLVLLDVGMESLMTQLAALRLAPVQCVAWDHPVTSGLPTQDYFLSGEAVEPANADAHYSEQLVLLPGLGLCCPRPVAPAPLTKTRAEFHLRNDAVLYLSCQSIFKYLPSQDGLFAQIAARVPTSQFVFLLTNEIVREAFQKRLDRAFSARGLRASDYCALLPEVSLLDFYDLNRLSDVFLDTIGWSGGISTLDAVACDLPIVTLPGPLMRGRQSAAILTQLGVTDTIATNEGDYVDLAVRLALDGAWRRDIITRMRTGQNRLFDDVRPVRALEAFYRRAVDERLSGRP